MAYYAPPPGDSVNALLSSGYTAPAGNAANALLSKSLGEQINVFVSGDSTQEFGSTDVSHFVRSIAHAGADQFSAGATDVRNAGEQIFPWAAFGANTKNVLLRSGYSPPQRTYIDAVLREYNSHLEVGAPSVQLWRRTVYEASSGFGETFGSAEARNLNRQLAVGGVDASGFGTAGVVNTTRVVSPSGAVLSLFGVGGIWNWRQYRSLQGFNATHFGEPYVQGGVKLVEPYGAAASVIGTVTATNTRADQTARPASIPAPGMGAVTVSPRFLRPGAIYGTAAGFPRVQFPPQPSGWTSSVFGDPVVEFKTKVVQPIGIHGYGEGFPRAADRARKVFHAASPVSAVFGDVQVRAKNFRVRVSGLPPPEIAPWTEARNTRRFLGAFGHLSQAFGEEATARNKTPSVAPAGFDAQQFGRSTHMVVGWRIRSVVVPGVPVPFPQFGAASLWKTPSLSPAGLAAPDVPAPTVWSAIRHVLASGSDMQRFGEPTVWFSYRFVVAKDRGIAGTSYGSARVEHGRRGIAMLGAPFMAFGAAWVSRGLRALAPEGIPEPFLHLHQIGGTRHLGPEGFESTRWLTRITPENREIFPKTFGAEYGWPTVQNRKRPVFPAGIRTYLEEGQHWGTARVWNLRQVVTMYEDQESGLWPLPWPQWTAIESRNKVMRASGFNAGRVGGAVVANNARLVQPSGIDHPVLPEYQKTGAVTHRARPLPLDGIEAPLMSRWIVVHNRARPLLPQGFAATLPGQAEVINLRRFYRMQGFYATEFGYPFVADRVRTLSFESRYGIQPPRIELPTVHLHTRYVESPGMAAPGIGNAALTVFFRRATPRWTHRDLFGDPFLKNMTPELLTRGRAHEDFGVHGVRLQWRPVKTDGSNTQLFGLTRISDRKQHLSVAGLNLMLVSDKVTVRRFGEDPVATQYIDLRKFSPGTNGSQTELNEGDGIPSPRPEMGAPDLLKGYIFHGKGTDQDMLAMGHPLVSANSIRVEPGIFGLYVGEPFVALRKRRIDAPTLGQLIIDGRDDNATLGSFGKPRLSPHTIYAVLEATRQAMRNHAVNPTSLHPVHWGIEVGHPRLSMWIGNIKPTGIGPSNSLGVWGEWGVGRPHLVNKRQVIAPIGTLMQRLGWPVIPGPQTIFIEVPVVGSAAGMPAVTRPPYTGPSTILTGNLSFQLFGTSTVSPRNRTVRPPGWFSQVFSTTYGSSGGIYLPQTLTVGPKMPVKPVGAAAGLYGQPWVSLRVRGLQAEGHDSFECEYDYQNFAKRMRVRNATDAWGGRRAVITSGHASSCVGAPGLRNRTQYIRPDGNSDQHRKGAF